MQPAVKTLACEMDDAYLLYRRALEMGEQIRAATDVEAITKIVDERWRVCNRSHKAMLSIKAGMRKLLEDPAITPSEKAFLGEKRKRLRDLAPKFTLQTNELRRYLGNKLASLRSEKVELKRNTHAIKQYISAPGSKGWVR